MPRARGHARRRRGDHDRGPRRRRGAASAPGGVRRARRVPVRLLHAGPDLLGGRDDRRGAGGLAERGHGGPDRASGPRRRRDPRAHERQPVPLRGLREHRPGDRGGGAMRPFAYERATDAAGAVAAVAEPGTMYLGGGTNLVDLMKLGVETPERLVDVSGLPYDPIEGEPRGGARTWGAGCNNVPPGAR